MTKTGQESEIVGNFYATLILILKIILSKRSRKRRSAMWNYGEGRAKSGDFPSIRFG